MSLPQPDSESDTEEEEEEEEEEEDGEEEEEEVGGRVANEEYDDEDSEVSDAEDDKKAGERPQTAPPTEEKRRGSSSSLPLAANCDTPPEGSAAEATEEATNQEAAAVSVVAPPTAELEWRPAYSGPDRATDMRDLTPATQYQLRVCAINAAGASPFSGSVAVEMPACVPGPVAALTPLEATATSVSFKFKKPACHGERIEEYNVEWTDKVRVEKYK